MRRPPGFSLVEVMLAMLLVLTILGMVSTLMREYSSVSRHQAARDNTFDGVQFGLAEMSHELGSAVQVGSPAAGASADRLTFYRIDPTRRRFPLEFELIVDEEGVVVPWNTRNTAKWLLVDYRKDPATNSLTRTTTSAENAVSEQVMVDKINSLSVKSFDDGYYDLALSFQEEHGRLRSFTMRARNWVRR